MTALILALLSANASAGPPLERPQGVYCLQVGVGDVPFGGSIPISSRRAFPMAPRADDDPPKPWRPKGVPLVGAGVFAGVAGAMSLKVRQDRQSYVQGDINQDQFAKRYLTYALTGVGAGAVSVGLVVVSLNTR